MPYRVMIVEDKYWTAMDLAVEIKERGAIVAGPFALIPKRLGC